MPQLPGEWIDAFDKTIGHYTAFLPASLPPTSGFDPLRVLAAGERAAHALGNLKALGSRLPSPELLSMFPLIREAHASARVEGTQTTLAHAFGIEDPPEEAEYRQELQAVLDHREAQAEGVRLLAKNGLDAHLLRRVHEVMFQSSASPELQVGRWRTQQNYIPGEHPGLQYARYVPPPPSDVPHGMEALLAFIRRREELSPLIRIGFTHAQFELIHPFVDGNGRMGRLLIILQILDEGLLQSPVLFLSDYFLQFRDLYFRCLDGVGRRGDWTSWLSFFLVGVEEVATAATDLAEKVLQLRQDMLREWRKQSRGQLGIRLLELLFEQPQITVKGATQRLQATTAPVNELVRRFVQLGWLQQVTPGRRNRRFVFIEYWNRLSKAGQLDVAAIRRRLDAALGPGSL